MKNETSRGWFSLATESVIIRVGRQDLLIIKRPKSEADYLVKIRLEPHVLGGLVNWHGDWLVLASGSCSPIPTIKFPRDHKRWSRERNRKKMELL